MKTLFVFNASAGHRDMEERRAAIEAWLWERGLPFHYYTGDLRENSGEEIFSGYDHVVAVGGDGTAFWTVNKLMEAGVRGFSLLPAGSGNDLARTLKIRGRLHDQLAAIFSAPGRPLDVGQWQERYFINIASAGLDADVNAHFHRHRDRLRKRRLLGWLQALVETAGSFDHLPILLHGREERLAICTLGNGRYYGGGFPILKEAEMDDGLLDLLTVDVRRIHLMIPFIISLFVGGSRRFTRGFTRERIQRLKLTLLRDTQVNLDGETFWYRGEVEVSIHPGALTYYGQ
ncbi:MAG: diacylglycerol kinase family protein [Tissierellia bacterium]|nr:diacylglycerol kinase family protein [Tissierellia bacterium]